MARATVYQKHSSVLRPKVNVYRVTRARCQNVKEGGYSTFGWEKPATEALANGGPNYEGPKVATFLVT